MCVTWLIHVCGMTHSYVWHDSFMCVPWLILVRGMRQSCEWHDSFVRASWLFCVCDMNALSDVLSSDGPGNKSLLLHLTCDSKLLDIHIYIYLHFLMYFSQHLMYSQSHVGWHFRMLFQSWKLAARRSLFTETWQKRRWSFELWALN